MGDPGLKSKFVAMQQDEHFSSYGQRQEVRVNNYDESRRLDIARIRSQLERATNPRHRKMLRRALRSLTASR